MGHRLEDDGVTRKDLPVHVFNALFRSGEVEAAYVTFGRNFRKKRFVPVISAKSLRELAASNHLRNVRGIGKGGEAKVRELLEQIAQKKPVGKIAS